MKKNRTFYYAKCTMKSANYSKCIVKIENYVMFIIRNIDKKHMLNIKECKRMLGGSFWVAVLRNGIGATLMMAVFLLLDHPRLSMKKTVCYYFVFALLAITGFSFWYLYDRVNFIRFSGMFSIFVVGIFCISLSREILYVSLYKLALAFYILSLTVFCSIDVSRVWFHESMWADIIIRFVMSVVIIFVIVSKIRKNFLEGIGYLRDEMDLFSAITVLLSIFIAAIVAFWPGTHVFSMFNIMRTVLLFLMSGVIQYMVFQLYLHKGKERRYQVEKELLETNERLIRRQLELMHESEEEAARIRHDARHHCILIEEYIRNGENSKLLGYVKQYKEYIESTEADCICDNQTINRILSVYSRWAEEKNIQVTMYVKAAGEIAVRDIDLVAVIANIFENAIHGCIASGQQEKKIYISVMRKGKKIVVQCRNTCLESIKLKNGMPGNGRGMGIYSVMKVVSYYKGEAEFDVKDGMFIVKILLNIS